jgi:hypothetical protein
MDALYDWLAALDPEFAFLLALPFLVAAAAFIGDAIRAVARRAPPRRAKRHPEPEFKRRVYDA